MTTAPRTAGRPAGMTGEELLGVARQVFLDHGYAGASMDEVAKRAKISKASLYKEHSSKQSLYAAVVRQWAAAGRDSMRPALERLADSQNIRTGLIELAETMRAGILSAPVLRMRRLVTGEALTQPEVAAAYLTESWDTNIQNLADTLAEISRRGRLRVVDAYEAAEQFTWLVIGAPLNTQLLTDDASTRGASVQGAVDLFLAGYGATSSGGGDPGEP